MASEAMERVEAYGKKGGASAALQDASQRLAALERQVAGIDLAVLDTAEKVATRLADRERKRTARAAEPAAEEEDDAAWWARARAAHPLPGMPAEHSQQMPLAGFAEFDA